MSSGRFLCLLLATAFVGCESEPEPVFECTFDRISGKFQMSPSQVRFNSNEWVLVERGDREFLFRRRDILMCEEASDVAPID